MNKVRKGKKITVKEIGIFTVIVFVAMLGAILVQDVSNLDTMWVFSFASKIADGAIPYLDFNMVMTPLSSQVTAMFLSIFGNTMLVSAFVGVIYGVVIYLMQYLILRKLNVNRKISALIVLLCFILTFNTIVDSYNILAYALVYVLLFIEICKIRYDKYVSITNCKKHILKNLDYETVYNIITGVILGLIVLTKQNIGAIAVVSVTVYYFLKCIYDKTKFTDAFCQLSVKAIFCIIPISIELIYLWISGALYYFIDYTVLGLNNFGQKVNANLIQAIFQPTKLEEFLQLVSNNPSIILSTTFLTSLIVALQSWLISVFMMFSIIFLVIMIIAKNKGKMCVKNKLDMNVMVLSFCFMFIGIIISVPLANQYHVILTSLFIIFLFLINFVNFISIQKWLNKNISTLSYYIMIIIPLIIGISYIVIYSLFAYKSQIDKFENMYISAQTDNLINGVVQYIKDYEKENNRPLYVITSNGVMYSLAMDRNNGVFDLPQYGNLGKDDYMQIINKLDSMKNFSVMIFKDDNNLFWQEPKEISEYIKKNYKYVAEYDMYEIYYKQ